MQEGKRINTRDREMKGGERKGMNERIRTEQRRGKERRIQRSEAEVK